MRRILFLILALTVAAGCGYNPDDPVYDTQANPHDFPSAALALIDSIEANPIYPADSISIDLADLYTYNPSLLDNERWHDVMSKLGIKFRHRADQLIDSGLAWFPEVTSLYALAAAARPDDEWAVTRSRRFFCFDSTALGFADTSADSVGLSDRLGFLHSRLFTEPICHAFTRLHLAAPILDPFLSVRTTAGQIARSLSPRQVALIDYLGYAVGPPDTTLVSFENPDIRLVARNRRLDEHSGTMQVELYFVAGQSLDPEWQFWLVTDSLKGEATADSAFGFAAAVPLTAWEPIDQWEPGRTMVVTGDIPSTAVNQHWQLTLVKPGEQEYIFARQLETGKMFVPLRLVDSKSSD